MENATKALLIAGSVLIAIVLIAVGLKILGSTKGVTDQVDDVSSIMETSIFNSQYTQYEGTQKGTVVKDLLSKVITFNGSSNNRKIKIQTVGTWTNAWPNGTYVTNNITKIRNEIVVTNSYTISTSDTDADGYVDKITLTK